MPGSTSHTPASTFHVGPFDLPNDGGDPYQYSSLMEDGGAAKGLFAKLFDSAKWLKDAVDALVSGIDSIVAGTTPLVSVPLTSRVVHRVYGSWFTEVAEPWVHVESLGGRPRQATADKVVTFPIDVPHGATLNSLSVSLTGPPDWAALPVNMPSVALVKVAGLTPTTVALQADTSADAAAYKAAHAVGLSGLTEVVDRSIYSYQVEVLGDGGAGWHAGLVSSEPSVYFTTTAIDLGAG